MYWFFHSDGRVRASDIHVERLWQTRRRKIGNLGKASKKADYCRNQLPGETTARKKKDGSGERIE